MAKKNALGRGLGALIEDHDKNHKEEQMVPMSSSYDIPVNSISTNPYNPRTHFNEELLQELAGSIKQMGVVQPITVRKNEDGLFQIISGERRFRAAKLAGMKKIPAYIRDADDNQMLEMALVENIQREDLDPIEVGLSYQRLMDECGFTQEQLSERIGKKRATIANYIRLLKLPAEVQSGLKKNDLSMGHARAIIGIEDEKTCVAVYKRIVSEELSVRQTEELVRDLAKKDEEQEKKSDKPEKNDDFNELQEKIQATLGSNVQFKRDVKGKGKIVISFNSDAELERIMNLFDKLNM
jgi:ParB family transcriptional regulator, chromosome partitioning protein